MDQMSFGDGEYASKRKRTRREKFLGGDGEGDSLVDPAEPD